MIRIHLFVVWVAAVILSLSSSARAVDVYTQPPTNTGALIQSSTYDPGGSDSDIWIWDSFILTETQAITEVKWRGGYIYNQLYGGPVFKFEIAFYASIAANSQPDVVNPPLVRYRPATNCGETAIGTFGGKTLYDYHYALPSAFQATGGVKYWVLIKAYQHGLPDWGYSTATGGNGYHFRWLEGGPFFQSAPGDAAFTLVASSLPTVTINASVDPAGTGTIQGTGAYPIGSGVTLVASANPGFGFVSWTENGAQVSTNAQYTFTANASRTLVAHFVPAYTVSTGVMPIYGGTVSAGGTFNAGASVTVTATPRPGFVLDSWLNYGSPVSTELVYTHTPVADESLTAYFVPEPNVVVFDFDSGPYYTSLPVALISGPLGVQLTGTGSSYSVQLLSALQIHPAGFAGACLYPNSVFAADLQADFSGPLTMFSILYSPQELGCDNSARMKATAYLAGVEVGSATMTATVPGTWPSDWLTYQAPAGVEFDRVVVHYDARPPTCQDWGPIFLADNIIARMATIPPTCSADFDGSGSVSVNDLFAFLAAWFEQNGSAPGAPSADFDGSGTVSVNDLFAFLAAWFSENGVC